jgi:hypothetical protein
MVVRHKGYNQLEVGRLESDQTHRSLALGVTRGNSSELRLWLTTRGGVETEKTWSERAK